MASTDWTLLQLVFSSGERLLTVGPCIACDTRANPPILIPSGNLGYDAPSRYEPLDPDIKSIKRLKSVYLLY
ncbi:hypothetical protein RIF29_19437 [Crotalaria pallida]|uniref:Uncharacterized protein n=1 Tax=Crotalaria pallida TaxID=3830 RepID=A0AAN9I5H4_CROPI